MEARVQHVQGWAGGSDSAAAPAASHLPAAHDPVALAMGDAPRRPRLSGAADGELRALGALSDDSIVRGPAFEALRGGRPNFPSPAPARAPEGRVRRRIQCRRPRPPDLRTARPGPGACMRADASWPRAANAPSPPWQHPSFRSLDISFNVVQDLTGIGAFPALRELRAYENQMHDLPPDLRLYAARITTRGTAFGGSLGVMLPFPTVAQSSPPGAPTRGRQPVQLRSSLPPPPPWPDSTVAGR